MTKQELFDRVKDHLLKQNTDCCIDGEPTFANGDLRDAIGCLFPQDFNFNEITSEHTILNEEVVVKMQELGIITGDGITVDEKVSLLTDLETLHDINPVNTWPAALKDVAARHNLTI